MNLEEFYNYKTQLMADLLTDEEIVHLIDENIPVEDARSLSYTQVFPCEYVPETVQSGRTYICFDVDILRSAKKPFYLPVIYVWIFTHQSLLRLKDGRGVRTDALCAAICRKLNGSMKYGMGELELDSVKRFAPMTDYNGKVMTFYAKDISRTYDPNKDIPHNRKVK